MTIDRLGDSTILVTLTGEDMRRYQLDFGEDMQSTRKGLTRLMLAVGEECGLSHRDKSYLIEALPYRESCLLIISVRITHSRRKYRIKRDTGVLCCRFDGIDDFLDWQMSGICRNLSYTLYKINDNYYLLPEYPVPEAEQRVLSEYGSLTRERAVTVARVREYGKYITGHYNRHRYFRTSSSAAM